MIHEQNIKMFNTIFMPVIKHWLPKLRRFIIRNTILTVVKAESTFELLYRFTRNSRDGRFKEFGITACILLQIFGHCETAVCLFLSARIRQGICNSFASYSHMSVTKFCPFFYSFVPEKAKETRCESLFGNKVPNTWHYSIRYLVRF